MWEKWELQNLKFVIELQRETQDDARRPPVTFFLGVRFAFTEILKLWRIYVNT